jgi:hypothetical protein
MPTSPSSSPAVEMPLRADLERSTDDAPGMPGAVEMLRAELATDDAVEMPAAVHAHAVSGPGGMLAAVYLPLRVERSTDDAAGMPGVVEMPRAELATDDAVEMPAAAHARAVSGPGCTPDDAVPSNDGPE